MSFWGLIVVLGFKNQKCSLQSLLERMEGSNWCFSRFFTVDVMSPDLSTDQIPHGIIYKIIKKWFESNPNLGKSGIWFGSPSPKSWFGLSPTWLRIRRIACNITCAVPFVWTHYLHRLGLGQTLPFFAPPPPVPPLRYGSNLLGAYWRPSPLHMRAVRHLPHQQERADLHKVYGGDRQGLPFQQGCQSSLQVHLAHWGYFQYFLISRLTINLDLGNWREDRKGSFFIPVKCRTA